MALRVAGNHLFPKAQKVLDVALLACMSPNILTLLPGGALPYPITELAAPSPGINICSLIEMNRWKHNYVKTCVGGYCFSKR